MSTNEQVRGYLLVCTRAFSGKRGRTGLVSFVLGQAGPSTLALAEEQGVAALHGILSMTPPNEIHLALNKLREQGCVEVRDTLIRDRALPLLYLLDKGSFELERLRPILNLPAARSARTTEKALLVLTRLGKLMEGLATQPKESLSEHIALGVQQFEHYIELLCKALELKKDVPLSSPQAQRHFANRLEVCLCMSVFAELPEVEAQALRLATGIGLKHQLKEADFAAYYPQTDMHDKARIAAARVLSREWQGRSPLASVIGFLVLSEPN
ncbi:MAG: hypothetical protein KGZ53_10170 [Peptococcaceae bacterium]|nr:hypothetical protein [Peptococcaceae bacterium]